jgi:hypothetical protein
MRDGSRARWRRVDKRRHRKSVDNFDFIFYWTKLNLLCFLSLGGWVGLPNTQSTNKQSRREREREKRSNSGTLEIGAGSFVFVFLLLFCFYQCVCPGHRLSLPANRFTLGVQPTSIWSDPPAKKKKTDNNKNNMWLPLRSISRHSLNRKERRCVREFWMGDNYRAHPI